jgi:AcrR family transcriptional regulator
VESPDESLSIRRRPEQARSRTLVSAVLDAAKQLLVEAGADDLTMTGLAERSGVGATAIYRYFPNKDAVLRELALETFSTDAWMSSIPELANGDLATFVEQRIQQYWQLYRQEPFRVPLRAAIESDPELGALDRADTRRVAAEMAHAAAAFTRFDEAALELRIVLILEEMQSAFRLAAHADHAEAERIIETFTEMTLAALA